MFSRLSLPWFALALGVSVTSSFAASAASAQLAGGSPTVEEAKSNAPSGPEVQPPDATLTGTALPPASPWAWWYRTPATKFWEGLPLATGRFAAMVYGRVRDEVIPFNDETLWTGSPYNPSNPRALPSLPKLRALLAEEKFGEAAELANNFLSYPVPVVQTYQAMGRLHLRFAGHAAVQDYRRELDLDSATARVSYRIGEARYTREMFASYPDQVVVVRLTCDRPGQLTFDTALSSLHASATGRAIGTDTILLEGGVSESNRQIPSLMRWQGRVRVIPEGGTVRIVNDAAGLAVRVERADAVTILLVGATNYKNWHDLSADPAARCAAYLSPAAARPFAELKQHHLADYQPLFRACRLDLGTTAAAREGHHHADGKTPRRRHRSALHRPVFPIRPLSPPRRFAGRHDGV